MNIFTTVTPRYAGYHKSISLGIYELSLLEAGTSLKHIGILSYFVSFK